MRDVTQSFRTGMWHGALFCAAILSVWALVAVVEALLGPIQ